MKWATRINILLGFWLIVSPWVLGYGYGVAVINDVVLGTAIAAISLWSVSVPSTQTTPAWINVMLGVWLIAAPWILGVAGAITYASANDTVIGLLTIIFAGSRIATSRPARVA
jgi:hypothetical protein